MPLPKTLLGMKAQYFPLPPIIEIPAFLQHPIAAKKAPATPTPQTRYIDPEPLGEGGTALIYKMKDTRLERPVVFKRFKKNEDLETVNDYRAELSAIALIHHPNVVNVFDAGKDKEGDFIIMEHIDGVDVEELIQESPLDLVRFLEFASQCLEGLLAVHEAGLLHLDLKPSNVMVSQKKCGNTQVKLIDFGRTQHLIGEDGKAPLGSGMNSSIFYASPEQLLSEPLDARSDLYALGCIFYWCLTGKRPFDGKDTLGVIASHLQNKITPLDELSRHLPKPLTEWVMGLLKFDRTQRPTSTRSALQEFLHLTYSL